MVKKLFVVMLFWLISFSGFSQNLISFVTVNPDNAYIGQPVQLKVSVYTTTWFTKGVDVGNIQVDDALTVYFRSVSNTRTFSGKKYAGVDFYYNLFPTDEGILTIPELKIQVESPKEGGYKGIKHTLATKPKTITVKGVPLGYAPANWLVARSLNVTEKWSVPLNNVKVGDVILRTISRSAGGTLSEFIPETVWDSIYGISIYPRRPIVNTHKSKTAVSSSRSETVNYLFEKEGKITIPAIEYLYWNSVNKKFYKKQIDSITINVKPNADLAMLASIKKSLQKEKVEEVAEEEKAFLIFGMSPKKFVKYLVFVFVALFILFKIAKKILYRYKEYKDKYLKSEVYAFKLMEKSIKKNDFNAFITSGNKWLSKIESKSTSLQEFAKNHGTKKLVQTLGLINESYFKFGKSFDKKSFDVLWVELKISRKNFLDEKKIRKKFNSKDQIWLNPTSVD